MAHGASRHDSSASYIRALGRLLHGKDVHVHPADLLGATALDALPGAWRERVHVTAAAFDALRPMQLGDVREEDFARWTVHQYPHRTYPAAAIGASSGALVHLCAALGIPWLPQTFLIPVRGGGPADDPRDAMLRGARMVGPLLDGNPEALIHHVHDPVQARRTLGEVTSFRLKRTRLGAEWAAFLRQTLSPGATIFVIECRRAWPVTRVGERHVFQMGSLGAATPGDYFSGSDRVREFLAREGAAVDHWDPPPSTELGPEAEWGFSPELLRDVEAFARAHGFGVARVLFDEPEELSPLVADLYDWWYARRGLQSRRLLAESYVETEPYWTLKAGAVPFWMKSSMEDDANALDEYLCRKDWDYVHLTLDQHGVEGPALASIERWRELLDRAHVRGEFLGIDPAKHPSDFAAVTRAHVAARLLPEIPVVPSALTLEELEEFLAEKGDGFPVRWVEGHGAPPLGEVEVAAR